MNDFHSLSAIDVSHHHHDPAATIGALFLGQVRHRPDKIAIIEGQRRVTYHALAGQAAGVAGALRAAGIARGDRVAILARRSIETVAAQLGVTAIGAAFVPLDPAAPRGHHRAVMGEAGAGAVLVHPDQAAMTSDLAAGLPMLELDGTAAQTTGFAALLEEPACQITAEDPAYVIYTSGSTGRSKGVMVAHRGVCRLVRGQDYADLGPDQVMLNMAAVGFDASIGEIYSAVLNGGTLVVLPDAAPSLDRIEQVIAEGDVTIAYVTAGLFHIIAEHRPQLLAPLQQVFPCGDVLSEVHVKRIRAALPHLRMINGYGPTENTVFTCCFPIGDDWTGGPVPIGRGLNHDRLFVLDDDLRPLPDGEIGQLAVGGAGVAIGYLGRPDLTDAAFVTLTAGGCSGRVYLTGDLVMRGRDGVVHFHGRADRQVKINGQRVELDSVEHALRADDAVEDAVAVALRRPDGSRRITAFVKPLGPVDDPAPFCDALLGRLRRGMSAAAVPARVELRGAFPLSSSGKVDRRALVATLDQAAAPQCATAQSLRSTIRQVWHDVLGGDLPDETRTFFDLGGTSLQLITVHALLQERLGRRFDIALLFEAPRIRDLERRLDERAAAPDPIAARRAVMARARRRNRVAAP
ncbi:non-ribosomal peptide synthetase [Oceaniglobus trochenteri]|uniref:non-ribosomal peptide synthetase n=1 Tax=Oceaniglobus trochenteri TaxID=2763260 RepID=UPI001CFFB2DE|nr:non-ribosomal peptide synthetase [Oceaniglobus trochenteri]